MSYPPLPERPAIPAPQEGGCGGTVLAWAIILAIVGYMLLGTMLPQIRGRTPGDEDTTDPQLTLVTKYVLGMKSLFPVQGDALFPQLDTAAKTSLQKLHAAIVAGEFFGADETLERLHAMEIESPALRQDVEDFWTLYVDGSVALNPEARNRLLNRHDFFARLALIHWEPQTDPARKALIDDCKFSAIALIVFIALAGIAGLVGLILFIIAVVSYFSGTLRPAYEPPRGDAGVHVEMFAVYLLSFVVLSLLIALIARGAVSLSWSLLLTIVVPLALAWGLWRGLRWSDMRMAIGWHSGRGALVEFAMGIVGYIAGLPVVAFGFVITLVLMKLTGTTPSHPVQNAQTSSPVSILLLYIIAAVWAPVIEETMFRGALYHHLRAGFGWIISALIVGVIFAAIHPQGWTFIPVLGAIGFVLACLREWRGSILAPMTAHALNNFVMITLLIAVK